MVSQNRRRIVYNLCQHAESVTPEVEGDEGQCFRRPTLPTGCRLTLQRRRGRTQRCFVNKIHVKRPESFISNADVRHLQSALKCCNPRCTAATPPRRIVLIGLAADWFQKVALNARAIREFLWFSFPFRLISYVFSPLH
jgi:hypothetical protein